MDETRTEFHIYSHTNHLSYYSQLLLSSASDLMSQKKKKKHKTISPFYSKNPILKAKESNGLSEILVCPHILVFGKESF